MTNQALEAISYLVLLLAAIGFERWLPLSSWYHPLTLARVMFANVIARTFKADNSVPILTSALAICVCAAFPVILIALFSDLVYYPELLAALILYMCLDSHTALDKSKRISQALLVKQKSLARALVAKQVVRDCDTLSEQGIAKACIHGTVLQFQKAYFVPLFWFLVSNAYVTLFYCLLLLLHQQIRKHFLPNSPYLFPTNSLLLLFQAPVFALNTLIIMCITPINKVLYFMRIYGRHYPSYLSGMLLCVISAKFNIQLGGPAFYQAIRFEGLRISTQQQCQSSDIVLVRRLMRSLWVLWLGVIAGLWMIWAL